MSQCRRLFQVKLVLVTVIFFKRLGRRRPTRPGGTTGILLVLVPGYVTRVSQSEPPAAPAESLSHGLSASGPGLRLRSEPEPQLRVAGAAERTTSSRSSFSP
eukprot:138034-Rhodomonas_salina.3